MHRQPGSGRQPEAHPHREPGGASPTAAAIGALNRLLVALEGRRNFLGTDWGIARVSDASVAYSFRRGGAPAGHMLYLDIPWALGSIERISERDDGTTELLVAFPARQVTYLLEGLFGGRMRRLQHQHVGVAPVRVLQRHAALAEEAVERLIRDSGWRRPGSGPRPGHGDRPPAPRRFPSAAPLSPAAPPASP